MPTLLSALARWRWQAIWLASNGGALVTHSFGGGKRHSLEGLVKHIAIASLVALAAPVLASDVRTAHTVESARYLLSIPDDYGPTAAHRKTLDPIIRQCGSDLATIGGLRKGDSWFDFKPARADQRGVLLDICAAYQVGLADGIGIGSRSRKP